MSTETALRSVTELRSAAFDLLQSAADRRSGSGLDLAAAVAHLQVVANELGVVEELLRDADRPTPPYVEALREHLDRPR